LAFLPSTSPITKAMRGMTGRKNKNYFHKTKQEHPFGNAPELNLLEKITSSELLY
jgi:hypothetical protein